VATILDIDPVDLPVHPIYVTGMALVTDVPSITDIGTRILKMI
jgi:hypothetical protein